eukprot:TRINITY_DN6009_c0_g1_i1.p1 TRINITY_DN6009_c0_g1~~TRINITY_DN6009_c0_g1_i1.p1  ORF type:complete len:355 (-),score=84.57 TRINITY_DN6009_c0_g1_i1:136-1200(-)
MEDSVSTASGGSSQEAEELKAALVVAFPRLEVEDTDDEQASKMDELQHALDAEVQRRRAAESLAAEREGQLRHLRERLETGEKELKERTVQLTTLEGQLQHMRHERNEAQTMLSARAAQLEVLQKQVDELSQKSTSRHVAQDSKESDLLVAKELVICNLQQQLTTELQKRQAVQRQVIEKDMDICKLQALQASMQVPLSAKSPAAAASLTMPMLSAPPPSARGHTTGSSNTRAVSAGRQRTQSPQMPRYQSPTPQTSSASPLSAREVQDVSPKEAANRYCPSWPATSGQPPPQVRQVLASTVEVRKGTRVASQALAEQMTGSRIARLAAGYCGNTGDIAPGAARRMLQGSRTFA